MPKTLVPKTQSTRQSKQPRGSAPATGLTAGVKDDSRKTVHPERPGITKPRRNPSPGKRKPRKRKNGAPAKPPAKRDEERMSRTSGSTGSPEEPANVNTLTITETLEDWHRSISVPEVNPSEPQALAVLGEFLVKLDQQVRIGTTDVLDRSKGALSWFQGRVLSMVYPLDRERLKGVAKRGQWGEFKKKYWKYGDSTAYWVRRIYETWPDDLQEVKRLGYSGCLEQLAPSFCRSDEGVESKQPSPSPSSEEPQDPSQSPPPPPTGNLLRTLATAAEKLSCATGDMPERFYAPEKQIQIIKDHALTIDSIICNLRRAKDNLQKLEIQAAQQVLDDAHKEREVGAEMGEINDAT